MLGKLSGRNAFKATPAELGIETDSEAEINAGFARFKDLADRKSEIFDEDIIALVGDESVTSEQSTTGCSRWRSIPETGERPQRVVLRGRRVEHRVRATATGQSTPA